MNLDCMLVSGVGEVVGTFPGGVASEKLADGSDDGFDGSRSGFAERVFELGFDRVHVG